MRPRAGVRARRRDACLLYTSEVVDDGGFTLLPAGTYAFEVAKIERERFEGSDKMEACPRAKVTLNVWTSQGWAPVVDRLMLNTKTVSYTHLDVYKRQS